ncbi:hypothetical protein CROQUDRAFT_356462 [Cronartium quercuum f. sp. fusiforme G11]|uniref:BED-type domain-containing protein n=1 Tax=Cronartium quercuum f. sp. fusiforme G11 TaxID=708437 RepID=A0A9P6NB16_9BASI|nr:hypothetical protein CROQUDRAFT_356462 [Cronartium quercuum f. sp. fusiforme G11]
MSNELSNSSFMTVAPAVLIPAPPPSTSPPAKPGKTSWVWRYFTVEIVDGKKTHICQAPSSDVTKPGICKAKLTPDKTASTKSLSRHLDRRHGITANKPPVDGTSMIPIPSTSTSTISVAKPLVLPKPLRASRTRKLNRESLKEALFDFVLQHELPLTTVEHPTFMHLLEVCNPEAKNLAIKSDNLTEMIGHKYRAAQDALKVEFANLKSKVSISMNVWDLKNDFLVLEISAHWIRSDWKAIDATLSITKLEAIHTEVTLIMHSRTLI